MPLSWNEIRQRAIAFTRQWADASRERSEAQTFWNELFAVFGKSRRAVASFEEPVKNLTGDTGSSHAASKNVRSRVSNRSTSRV